jgi:hypothetical protein
VLWQAARKTPYRALLVLNRFPADEPVVPGPTRVTSGPDILGDECSNPRVRSRTEPWPSLECVARLELAAFALARRRSNQSELHAHYGAPDFNGRDRCPVFRSGGARRI